MEKMIVRWEAKRISHETTRYALRTQPKGKGIEIGAYSSWENARAEEAAEKIARAIEDKARAAGYQIGEETWNDLAE